MATSVISPKDWVGWAKRAKSERILVRVGTGDYQHVRDDLDPARTMCGRVGGTVIQQSAKPLCGTCIWSWESRERDI